MDRRSKKRARSDPDQAAPTTSRKGKKKAAAETPAPVAPAAVVDPSVAEEGEGFKIGSIFEFPWQKERLVADTDPGCDLRDVFFASLVDGCRAAIGFPGDRLSPSRTRISLPEEVAAADVADCVWSCVLCEPLPLALRCVQ